MPKNSFGYAHDMFDGVAGGLKATNDTLDSIRNYERARAQRWSDAEAHRLHSSASGASNASTYNQDYKAWADKVGGIINNLYDRAYQGLLNLNLHSFSQLHDATVCRVCMQIDTRYTYYISGMFTSFNTLLFDYTKQRAENHWRERDELGFNIICQNCIGNTRGFNCINIERSLPQPEPDAIYCSNKKCRRVTDEVLLCKLSL